MSKFKEGGTLSSIYGFSSFHVKCSSIYNDSVYRQLYGVLEIKDYNKLLEIINF